MKKTATKYASEAIQNKIKAHQIKRNMFFPF